MEDKMKPEEIVYDPEYYIEQIDHSIPVLHYHLGTLLSVFGGDLDDEADVLDFRIDGSEHPFYPGDSVIFEIRDGELDPHRYGMLPYMRGWEWCLWLPPMPWLKYLPKELELKWITGGKILAGELTSEMTKPLFGMLPAGLLVGAESTRFGEGRWLHDQIIERFREASDAEACTRLIFEKSFAGDWYFPDVMVIMEDLWTHVERHKNTKEQDE